MEKDKALAQELASVYQEYIDLIDQFPEEQINVIPFDDSWTAGQVCDHITQATSRIPDKNVADADRPIDQKIPAIEAVFLDFSTKLKSPDFVLPGPGPFNKSALLELFAELKSRHTADILAKDLSKVCLGFELPFIGSLTRYEWYRFFVIHGRRHLHQLRNIHEAIKN